MARSGFLIVERASRPFACILIFPPPLSCQLGAGRTLPAFDIGGGLELFPTARTFVRLEIGDRVLKYPGTVLDNKGVVRSDSFFSHDFRFAAGAGLRFWPNFASDMTQKPNAGRSAYGAAMMKALESFLPTGQRLFDDTLVLEFLPRPLRFSLRSAWVRRQFAAMMDRGAPGIRRAILCRTRYIDDVVRDAVSKGTTAVVFLVAGLDTRPYRLSELSTVKVVEVDLPALQAHKKAQVVRRFGSTPPYLRFVSSDFETEPLDMTLDDVGTAEYRARHLTPRGRDLDVAEIERVARAFVGVHWSSNVAAKVANETWLSHLSIRT
jgi:Leucine carboxyl methyltransferase